MKLKTKIGIGFLYYFAFVFTFSGIAAGVKYLPMSLIGIAIGYFTYRYMKRKQAEAEEQEDTLEQLQISTSSEPHHNFNLVAPDKEEEKEEDEEDEGTFSIKGINYANLDDSYLGDHDGYIKAVTDNPKDPYAIGVYVGRKRVGWLPGGNSELHAELLNIGGKAKVNILISKGYDDYDNHPFYYGKAVIPR